MKWFLIVFSLYVIVLSAFPCCGDDYCCEEITEVSNSQQHRDHDNHNKPELPCSPFFSCNTCHGVIVPELLKSEPAAVPLPRNVYYTPTAPGLPEFPASIWQPPKFA
ncbi:hypothetical protein DVR12_23575 [Chitinophaga silvatica]|uniref:Uncharacterized protein n=1 Tax=Chitinophaga silvatica TaxID=2282649 RepID=A0A3E1Y3H1_9BACT|nr:DUF6660 family protein [Chitinophaga silvatica]RFS19221.1 hypothetical protein DVR12_23575 [Chitinophaga silvatica]